MYPRIGPLLSYTIFYVIGLFLHIQISAILAKTLKLRRRIWISISVCYILSMTIGAKVLYDIVNSRFDFSALFTIKYYTQAGMWGGLLVYLTFSVPVIILLSKQKRATLDLVAMTIPIPFIFAKLGCLFHGCCYGKPCNLPWAITFPKASGIAPAGIPLHPTQIYEIILMFIIIIVFIKLRGNQWRGAKILWFLALYGFGRAVIEMFRGDFEHHRYIGPITLSQLLCIAAAGGSAIFLILWFKIIHKSNNEFI